MLQTQISYRMNDFNRFWGLYPKNGFFVQILTYIVMDQLLLTEAWIEEKERNSYPKIYIRSIMLKGVDVKDRALGDGHR